MILLESVLSSEKDVVSLRNKVRESLYLLTMDQMYSTQKATILSNSIKSLLKEFDEIRCSISLKNPNTTENGLDIVLSENNSAGKSTDNKIKHIKKLSLTKAFDLEKLDNVKTILNIKTVNELLVNIQHKNIELEKSLRNLRIAKDQNARMESELEVGKSIQMGMLPLGEYKSDSIDLYAMLIPAREVGGDFYDFFEIGPKRLGIVMGDVSGKGVPAALMMAVCKTLLKSEATGSTSSAEVITQVNNIMAAENKNYMFVTVFLGILDTETGELVFTNAGHCPTYILRKEGKLEKLTEVHGPAVAAMEGIPFREAKIKITSGDKIIAYTDGIPEAHDINKNLYGDARLEKLLLHTEKEPRELADSVIKSVEKYEEGTERFDDLTILCLKYLGTNHQILSHES